MSLNLVRHFIFINPYGFLSLQTIYRAKWLCSYLGLSESINIEVSFY